MSNLRGEDYSLNESSANSKFWPSMDKILKAKIKNDKNTCQARGARGEDYPLNRVIKLGTGNMGPPHPRLLFIKKKINNKKINTLNRKTL